MTRWLIEKNECPLCRIAQLGNVPMNQEILQRLVARIVVSCPHNTDSIDSIVCTWKGPQDDRERHLSHDCPLEPISCVYACDEKIPRYRREMHLIECVRRPIPCDLCKGDVALQDMKSHQSEICSKRMVQCPRCKIPIPADKSESHLRSGECPTAATVVCYNCRAIFPKKFENHKCTEKIDKIARTGISFGTTNDYPEGKSTANPIYRIDKAAADAHLTKNNLIIGDWDVIKIGDTLLVLPIFVECADCDRRICRHAPYWAQARYSSHCLFEVYLCNLCIDRVSATEYLTVHHGYFLT